MKEITDLQREMLKKYNLDAMVTMTPENITYVTGAYIPTQVTVRSRKVIHIITEKHDPVVIVVNIEEPIMRTQSWMDPKSIISYNVLTKENLVEHTYSGHSGWVTGVSVSADEQYLASR